MGGGTPAVRGEGTASPPPPAACNDLQCATMAITLSFVLSIASLEAEPRAMDTGKPATPGCTTTASDTTMLPLSHRQRMLRVR